MYDPTKILLSPPRYLLSLGAEKDVVNSEGEKPCELIDSDCEELVQLFSTKKRD